MGSSAFAIRERSGIFLPGWRRRPGFRPHPLISIGRRDKIWIPGWWAPPCRRCCHFPVGHQKHIEIL